MKESRLPNCSRPLEKESLTFIMPQTLRQLQRNAFKCGNKWKGIASEAQLPNYFFFYFDLVMIFLVGTLHSTCVGSGDYCHSEAEIYVVLSWGLCLHFSSEGMAALPQRLVEREGAFSCSC